MHIPAILLPRQWLQGNIHPQRRMEKAREHNISIGGRTILKYVQRDMVQWIEFMLQKSRESETSHRSTAQHSAAQHHD